MGCLTLGLSIIFINVHFFSKIATSVIKAPFCQCQFRGKVTSLLDNGAFYRRLWNQIHFNVILSSAGQLKKIDVDRSHWNRKCKIKQKNHNKKTHKTNNKNSQYDDQQIGYAAWNAKATRKSYMTKSNKLNKNTDMGIKKPL